MKDFHAKHVRSLPRCVYLNAGSAPGEAFKHTVFEKCDTLHEGVSISLHSFDICNSSQAFIFTFLFLMLVDDVESDQSHRMFGFCCHGYAAELRSLFSSSCCLNCTSSFKLATLRSVANASSILQGSLVFSKLHKLKVLARIFCTKGSCYSWFSF